MDLFSCTEALTYIENEIKPGDDVEISYDRIYIKGTVITNNNRILVIGCCGENLRDVATIDLENVQDVIIEVKHIKDGKETIVRTCE